MNQKAIEEYFKAVSFSSFCGTLQSLAQVISRESGVLINGYDVLEYFCKNSGLKNFRILICFSNGKTEIYIHEI